MTSIALVVVGTWLCYKSITDSIDKSIEELIASNLPQVGMHGDQPYFLFAREKFPMSGLSSRALCSCTTLRKAA